MPHRKPNFLLLAAVIGSICYPLLVYNGFRKFPVSAFIAFGLVLIALRLAALRKNPDFKLWAAVFAAAAFLLIAVLFISPAYAAQTYPVAVSLSVAAIFGLSLVFPPPIVERIARFSEPNLPPEGVKYTRNVTIIWAVYLVCNAALSAGLAVWGTIGQWTLWTGLFSYLAMGVLFAGEYAVRKIVRK